MIRHIVAVDERSGIARGDVQPWQLIADERYFARQTRRYGAVLLAGARTYDAYRRQGRTLPGRTVYVLSRHLQNTPYATVVHDLPVFLARHTEDIWVIGGASLYAQTMPMASELYITRVQHDYGCTLFYPAIPAGFELVSVSDPLMEAGVSFSHEVYVRS